ncbi:MAG: pantetheine-phosphate adenylyltransferase [Chloroflexota bacterium]
MADAGRVIAGRAAGRRLLAPGGGTRPLADRVKEALFAILEPDLPGARVLDLFAGSGAGGIEALSRGAAAAIFVEREPRAARTIEENLRRCGLAGDSAIVRRSEVRAYLAGQAAQDGPFDLVLVDPPYAEPELLLEVLGRLGDERAGRLVRPNGRVVAKHFWRDRPPDSIGLLASDRTRRFGESALTFYRRRSPEAPDRSEPVRSEQEGRMSVAVYPGSFDPVTHGHLDVVRRAAGVFDQLIIAVLANPRKTPLLGVEERISVIRRSLDAMAIDPDRRIAVEAFDGLTVDFCRARGARFIVRGLRAISDFESELQLAHNNRKLAPEVDTVFFMTALEHSYVSSSLVKEIALFGGDVRGMVPTPAAERLQAALRPSGPAGEVR